MVRPETEATLDASDVNVNASKIIMTGFTTYTNETHLCAPVLCCEGVFIS